MALPRSHGFSRPLHAIFARFHWIAIGTGVAATAFCAAIILAQTSISIVSKLRPLNVEQSSFQPPSTNAAAKGEGTLQEIRILTELGGETLSPSTSFAAAADRLIDEELSPNIAPAAWDDLPDTGNCLTVTTKSGEKFSFRIIGVDKKQTSDANGLDGELSLAIAECSKYGKTIEKAVIQPDPGKPSKPVAPARSL